MEEEGNCEGERSLLEPPLPRSAEESTGPVPGLAEGFPGLRVGSGGAGTRWGAESQCKTSVAKRSCGREA